MTATEQTPLVCPSCRSANTMIGAAGVGRCFECAYEWDPAVEVAAPAPVLEPFAMPTVEDVFGPEPVRGDVVAPYDHSQMIGGTARLEGGQVALVLDFPDDDHVLVHLNDGRTETVDLSDVEKITPRAPEPATAPAVETAADFAPEVQMALTLAELIVKAGIASLEGEGADLHPVAPPIGYLPNEADLIPVIEQAAALAVGMVILQSGVDVDELLASFGPVEESNAQGDQQTEVTGDEQHPSDNDE